MSTGSEELEAAARLGERLRAARLAHNMTQSEVAQGQFSVSYISAVERGQIRPSLAALAKLAARVQLSVADLVREDEGGGAPSSASRPRAGETPARDDLEQLLNEAQIHVWQRRPSDALTALSRLKRRTLNDNELAQWNLCSASAHVATGEADEARRELQVALSLAERSGDAELQERARYELGIVQQRLGQWQVALDTFNTCQRAADAGAILDPLLKLRILFSLGEISERMGDDQGAVAHLERAVALEHDLFGAGRLGEEYQLISASYVSLGNSTRARQYQARSLSAYEEAATRRDAAHGQTVLGIALAASGSPENALVYLAHARAVAEQRQDAPALAEAQRGLATVYLSQGRLDEAEAEVEKALGAASSHEDPQQQAEILLVQASIYDERSRLDDARANFERAISLLQQSRATQSLGDAYKSYADFLERHGDNARAYEVLKQAWELRPHVSADVQ